ncbi:MAG: hypothetical protein H8F28_21430 [Fibrella sp.]|nr:hypothetical protein [Armatimonadota bacterium]
MSRRVLYLCGIVFVLATLSAFADKRERGGARLFTPDAKKCATCAAYGPPETRCDYLTP